MKTIVLYINILLCVLFLLSACGNDFDERKDSVFQTISIEFDPSAWYDEVLELTPTICEKRRIPLATDDEHSLRVTGFCYDNNDSLLSVCEVLSKDILKIRLKFERIRCDEYCHIVIFADLVKNTSGGYEEGWTYLNRERYNELTVLSMGSSEPLSYHALYIGSIDAIPNNQCLNVNMQKASHNGYVRIVTTTTYENFYGNIKYPNRFQAKTLENTTLQSQEFRTPDNFWGELLFPITAINYGDEMEVSFSAKYKYDDVESKTFSVSNDLHQTFLMTVDCSRYAKTPIKLQNY